VITLDASVLIAYLRPQDEHHASAVDLLLDKAPDGFVVHSLNLAEVLVGGVRLGRGTEMLADLRAIGVELAEASPDEPIRLATVRVELGLKLPDCCALLTALTLGTPLATFDGALAAAARHRGVALLPG
jgi:predicted nucleic acid-binding protein